MDKNPLEQQNSQINIEKETLRKDIEGVFDDKEKLKSRVNDLIEKLDALERNGLAFNKEELTRGLIESINIVDREIFTSRILDLTNQIIVSKFTHPEIFRKVNVENSSKNREEVMAEPGTIRLSEVLHCTLSDNSAIIHLAPAYDLVTREKIDHFNNEIVMGLNKLAEIIKTNEEIKKVVATSWIVAKSPERMQKLGFTITGEISKEERAKHFPEETRPISKAIMTREDFLARYNINI